MVIHLGTKKNKYNQSSNHPTLTGLGAIEKHNRTSAENQRQEREIYKEERIVAKCLLQSLSNTTCNLDNRTSAETKNKGKKTMQSNMVPVT